MNGWAVREEDMETKVATTEECAMIISALLITFTDKAKVSKQSPLAILVLASHFFYYVNDENIECAYSSVNADECRMTVQ